MPVLTRKAVFLAVKAKYPDPKQRSALSQKLGKKWSYASTDALAQAVGLQGTPRKAAAKGTNRAKATAKQHGFARSFASENAAKNLSDNETKRALIKGRLVRSVKHAMTARENAIGRKLTPQEKKIVAAKAFSREVKAIKAGQPESKPKRGGNQKPSTLHTPPPGVSVAEHKAALRRQYGASSGSRSEQLAKQEDRRADIGNGMNGGSDRHRAVSDRVSEDHIPFGKTTTANKPPAKTLDGKLNSEQKTTIAAHLRKVESGAASSVPLRALQDASGQHWLEMKSASGKVGAVPIDAHGKKDNDRALHSDEWKAKAEGMTTIAKFPGGKAVKKAIPSKKADHQMTIDEYADAHPRTDIDERYHAHANAIADAIRSGKPVRGDVVRPYYHHPAVEAAYIEKDRNREASLPDKMKSWAGLHGELPKDRRRPEPVTKTKPWAGDKAPLQGQKRAELVRGRSID
jgi:hypothetical protein